MWERRGRGRRLGVGKGGGGGEGGRGRGGVEWRRSVAERAKGPNSGWS